jgi:hypothetical protein
MLICAPVKVISFFGLIGQLIVIIQDAKGQPPGQGGIIIVEALEIFIKSASR